MTQGASRPVLTDTFTANGPVARHRCVDWTDAQVTAQGATVKGVVLENYANADAGYLVMQGIVAVEAAAAINVATDVMASADGRIMTWVVGAGQQVCGRTIEAASAPGHIVAIELRTEAAGMP